MQKRSVLIVCVMAVGMVTGPVLAASAPASLCLTASVKAKKASVEVRMENDIAPYAANTKADEAVKKYRDGLGMAWDAMEEPYCGYGAYGATSALKSYTKTVDRTRATFLVQIKNLAKASVTLATAAPTNSVISSPPTTPVVQAKPVVSVPSGLHIGLRSDGVLALQKKLTAHFGLLQDDSTVTGYFGPKTKALVIKFQIEKNIITTADDEAAGLVGPRTSVALNKL